MEASLIESTESVSQPSTAPVVAFSSARFLLLCIGLSAAALWWGGIHPFSANVIAAEVMATILCLFVFGSTRFQLHKNALTYGAGLVISATFFPSWWPGSALRQQIERDGLSAVGVFLVRHLRLSSLEQTIHADTMLFILGLTYFVSVISQTRMLEALSFRVLKWNRGHILPTLAVLIGVLSVLSGALGGVSMIGLMIRTLVIILLLSKTDDEAVIFAVIVSTVVTTVCGVWIAYGEPPNLIMKANLEPYLTNGFFLGYGLPVTIGTYLIVLWNVRKRVKGQRVLLAELDVLDVHTAEVRFLQAARHGEVLTSIEFAEDHSNALGSRSEPVVKRLHHGEPLGLAMIREGVPERTRRDLLGRFVSEDLAAALDDHYQTLTQAESNERPSGARIGAAIRDAGRERARSQWIGTLSFVPFIGLLIAHGVNDATPLFWSSFAAFAFALLAIKGYPKMRALAFREAKAEYLEYLFLFPLFFSITLLQRAGFFAEMASWLRSGIATLGTSLIGFVQYAAACVLSALLDNNIVADFASRALHGLSVGSLRLFSMAQIAGYAAGGCWTHIGSAQSVVAYAFVLREIDDRYTPAQWIKAMTPVILQISVLMAIILFAPRAAASLWHAL